MTERLIVWMECGTPDKPCYVWPISAMDRVGRCGYCGVQPHTFVPEPASGRAEKKVTQSKPNPNP